MGSHFGKLFSFMTFGESHGKALGVVIEGGAAGIPFTDENLREIQRALDRRRPGQSEFTSPRSEPDQLECVSGIDQGVLLGSPVTFLVWNKQARSSEYAEKAGLFRPSHADYAYHLKYGISPISGGGRASARETIGRVIAGAFAKFLLKAKGIDLQIAVYVSQVHDVVAQDAICEMALQDDIYNTPLRCPDDKASSQMAERILAAKALGDTLGGVIKVCIKAPPKGLGEPVFDKLTADFAKAMMSLPATRGVSFGSGFGAALMKGSLHNDPFINRDGVIRTASNHSGGIQGGISNGEDILFAVAFKPVASIFQEQNTVSLEGQELLYRQQVGRHDPCVLPRAVSLVEAMTYIVLCDHYLRQKIWH